MVHCMYAEMYVLSNKVYITLNENKVLPQESNHVGCPISFGMMDDITGQKYLLPR